MREVQAVLRAETRVGRRLIALAAVPALCSMTLVVFGSYFAGTLEFTRVWPPKDPECLPALTVLYGNAYAWGWLAPPMSVAALLWLLYRGSCGIGTLVAFIGLVGVFTTLWLTFTLLALYVGNQTFHAGTERPDTPIPARCVRSAGSALRTYPRTCLRPGARPGLRKVLG